MNPHSYRNYYEPLSFPVYAKIILTPHANRAKSRLAWMLGIEKGSIFLSWPGTLTTYGCGGIPEKMRS
jgi:hypothetical protein